MDVIDRPVLDGASQRAGSAAFEGFVRSGATVEMKAFTGVTGDAGGFAVPSEIDATIDAVLKGISPIRSIANVVKVGSAGYRKLVTTGGTPSGWAAETDARPGTATPVFTEIAPPMGELYANPSASQAMLDDAAFDVEDWLAGEIAMEFAKAEGAAFVAGSGVGRPKGFLNQPTAATGDATRAFGTLQYLPSGAAGGGSVGAVLETLAQASGAWFAPEGGRLAMRDAAGAVASVADAGFGALGAGPGGGRGRRSRTVAAIETVPRTIAVGHYDPARDYQAGLQRAVRPGAGAREVRVEVPAVLDAGAAKTVAEAMLARAEAGRVTRSLACGFAALGIAPGTCVAVAGEAGVWRVTDVLVEGMVTRLTLVPLETAALPARATSGRVNGAADAAIGTTILAAFETPGLDDVPLSTPRLTIAAAGEGAGWRRAALLYSLDDGASWTTAGATAAPAAIGTVEAAPPRAPATLLDLHGALVVALAHDGMELGDADAAALDRGVNLAMAGEELVQFGSAQPLGGGRWRLTRLLRGRRGTERAAVATGDQFVLLEAEAARAIDLPVSAIGRTVRVMASGVGDDEPVEARCTIGGASVLPPSPVHLRREGEMLRWVRRSRAGWRWIDGVDAPLGEEAEAYRVTIGVRVVECAVPEVALTPTEIAAGVPVSVRQRGVFGESAAAELVVAGTGG